MFLLFTLFNYFNLPAYYLFVFMILFIYWYVPILLVCLYYYIHRALPVLYPGWTFGLGQDLNSCVSDMSALMHHPQLNLAQIEFLFSVCGEATSDCSKCSNASALQPTEADPCHPTRDEAPLATCSFPQLTSADLQSTSWMCSHLVEQSFSSPWYHQSAVVRNWASSGKAVCLCTAI